MSKRPRPTFPFESLQIWHEHTPPIQIEDIINKRIAEYRPPHWPDPLRPPPPTFNGYVIEEIQINRGTRKLHHVEGTEKWFLRRHDAEILAWSLPRKEA